MSKRTLGASPDRLLHIGQQEGNLGLKGSEHHQRRPCAFFPKIWVTNVVTDQGCALTDEILDRGERRRRKRLPEPVSEGFKRRQNGSALLAKSLCPAKTVARPDLEVVSMKLAGLR
jgi:hypothetical protein